jgi:hypothetical protein
LRQLVVEYDFSGPISLALWLRDAFPSAVRSYQALTFYPALAYGVDNNRIGSANFIGIGNRGPSGIVYRIEVACGRSKQSRHSAWSGRFSKITDPKFHACKIKRQRPISNDKSSAENCKLRHRPSIGHDGGKRRSVRATAAKCRECHISFAPPPCFEQIHPCFEQIHYINPNHYGSGTAMQTLLRYYPTVTCPGCKRAMTPSPPLPVSDDTKLCDVTYTCEDCGTTTTRTIQIEK